MTFWITLRGKVTWPLVPLRTVCTWYLNKIVTVTTQAKSQGVVVFLLLASASRLFNSLTNNEQNWKRWEKKIHKVFKRKRRKKSLIWYLKIFELMKKVFFFSAITGQHLIPLIVSFLEMKQQVIFHRGSFFFSASHHHRWLKWMNEEKVTQNSVSQWIEN